MTRLATWTLGPDPDVRAGAQVLAALELDLLLLADLPARRGALRRLLSASGLQVAARTGRGRAGSAVLVGQGTRVLSSSHLDLGTGNRARAASHAIVGLGGHTVQALAFRLGVEPDARRREADQVVDFLAGVDRPAVLGGDTREGAGGPVAAVLGAGRIDPWALLGQGSGDTYPTPEPMARHDVLLLDRGLVPTAVRVVADDVADRAARHRAVVVDLEDAA